MAATLVIYNPTAGNGRARAYWPSVKNALLDSGINFNVVETTAPFHAREISQALAQEFSQVIAVGGDGTVHEIVNGLMRASREQETIPLGVVPLGNGDDFAKMIPPITPVGGKPFGWDAAVEKISRGQTELFDVGRIMGDNLRPEYGNGPYYYANSFDVGFGAHGAQNLTTIPKYFKGLSAYLATIAKTMIHYPSLNLRLQLDDQDPFEQSSTITAVMNGRCLGNSFWFCPESNADDGLFDILVSKKVGRFTIMRLIPKLMRGTHTNEPVVSMFQARRVLIESEEPLIVETDGEIPFLETHRLELSILHKRLRVII
jgi:YegS/Rv2252/BmrU family lipid kinase